MKKEKWRNEITFINF